MFLCQILDVNGTGKSITIDWIGRDLYWLEETPDGHFTIRKYDLNRNNGHSHIVLQKPGQVGRVTVNPYHR